MQPQRSPSAIPPQHPSSSRRKHGIVAAACENCRQRRVKCDGERPCRACAVSSKDCTYLTNTGETQSQARTRRYKEERRSNLALNELLQHLLAADTSGVHNVRERLKQGHSIESVVAWLRGIEIQPAQITGPEDHAQQVLIRLSQSTAPLDDILNFVETGIDKGYFVEQPEFHTLYNRIITLDMLGPLVDGTAMPDQVASPPSQRKQSVYEDQDQPSFIAPALPWTSLTDDSMLVSQLVSVFINYVNPYWRYVEVDLFLPNMQSGVKGQYCCHFLVNAICAFACLFCEYDDAFDDDTDYITRGWRFHEEALRLWTLELGQATLTNLQALTILAMESSYRAKDKRTMSLISEAVRLNKLLPLDQSVQAFGGDLAYMRARTSIAWTIHHVDVACSTSLLTPSQPVDARLGVTSPLEADVDQPWSGRPYIPAVTTIRRNALFREICCLTRLKADLNDFLFNSERPTDPQLFSEAIKTLIRRFATWYENLPTDFTYRRQLAVPLYELHAEYHCAQMLLCSAVDVRSAVEISGDSTSPVSEEMPLDQLLVSELTTKGDWHALTTASLLRDYRETYGLKIPLPTLFQAEALTSFNLLRRLETATGSAAPVFLREGTQVRQDIHAAFTETFRCLLGTSTQIMLAKGVLRMLIETARSLKIRLPTPCTRILQVMQTWRPADVDQIHSIYPNYAVAKVARSQRAAQMEELLRRWETGDP